MWNFEMLNTRNIQTSMRIWVLHLVSTGTIYRRKTQIHKELSCSRPSSFHPTSFLLHQNKQTNKQKYEGCFQNLGYLLRQLLILLLSSDKKYIVSRALKSKGTQLGFFGFRLTSVKYYIYILTACHFLLQGIFLTQESNPGSPALQADSLLAELWGKPLKNTNYIQYVSPSKSTVCRFLLKLDNMFLNKNDICLHYPLATLVDKWERNAIY